MVLAAAVLCAARIVVTHTMGMMPVYGGDGGYSTMMREPGSPYGGLRRMRGLGASGERYRSGYRWDLEMAERQGVDVFGVLLSGNERSRQFWLGWLRTWTEMRAENPSLRIRLAPLFAGCDIVERRKDPGKFAYFRDVWNEDRDSPAWYRVDRRVMFVGYKSSMWWDARANSVDENVYYKLYIDGNFVVSCFVPASGEATITLPSGTYSMNKAYGSDWFGPDDMFGDAGEYYQCNFDGSTTVDLEPNGVYEISAGGSGAGIGSTSTDRGSF